MSKAQEFLGRRVVDRITGFSGVATSYVQYITGCNQVGVTPAVNAEGKMVDAAWIDEQRLDVGEIAVTLDNSEAPGFGEPLTARSGPPLR